MSQSDEKLFAALAREVARRVSEFKEQDFANTAWGFATLNQSDEKLFIAFAKEADRRMSEFNVQKLSQLHRWMA